MSGPSDKRPRARGGCGTCSNSRNVKAFPLVLLPLVVSCHLDKLLTKSGGGGPPSENPPAQLAFASLPATARAGEPISPPVRVMVQDSTGRVTTVDTVVTLSLGSNPGGATLSGTTQGHSVNGVATFPDLRVDKAGSSYTLTASSPGLPAATSDTLAVRPSAPTELRFSVQPSSAAADSVIKPPVQIAAYDSLGNEATNFTGSIRLALGTDASVLKNAHLGGHTLVAAAGGIATFNDLTIDQPGTGYTITAAFGTAAPVATSALFDIAPAPLPPPGGLTVTTTTTGANVDPDGYTVTVDGSASQTIAPSGSVTFSDLAPGSHTVTLSGVAANCTVTGGGSRTVTVTSGGTATAAFSVACSATTGNLTVTTTTSGSSQDPDGYTVTLDGGSSQAIGTSASVTFPGLAPGNHTVVLSGVAANCTVANGTSRTASVAAGGTASASFTVSCTTPPPPNQPPTAAFTSSCNGLTCGFTSTSSDPDGSIASYSWTFGDGGTATAQNPSHTYSAGGTYTVTLTVTDNQGATGNVSHTVTVTAPPPTQPPVVNAGPDESVLVGALYSLTASFSDPDHDGPWTYTIDWGDGSSSSGSASSEGSFGASHSYLTLLPASYTVTVTVVDSQGNRGSDQKVVTVTTL